MLFGRRFRVLVSVSAAFPVSATDGEVVYNYRGSIDTANFLGQLFRTLSQVLNLGSSSSNGSQPSELPEVTNEEPNNSPGATSRNKVSKKRKKSKVMSKVMAVRQQQQTAPTGFEPGQSESPPTRWDLSAQSLLNMTRTFLRHVPEKVVNHPRNSGIISRLCDLTAPDAVTSFRSRTIQWSCLMALQLLHLSPVKGALSPGKGATNAVNIKRDGSSSTSSASSSPSKVFWSPSRKRMSKRKKKKRSAATKKLF